MSTTKFTPMPWNVEGYRDGFYKILGAQIQLDPEDVLPHLTSEQVTEIDEANCALISAAPELLYALEEILPYMDRVPKSVKDNSPFAHRMKVALDAIAKAKGGSK